MYIQDMRMGNVIAGVPAGTCAGETGAISLRYRKRSYRSLGFFLHGGKAERVLDKDRSALMLGAAGLWQL
jgi:hypothetical protein